MVTLLTLIIYSEFPLDCLHMLAFDRHNAAPAGEGPLKIELKRNAGREKAMPTENCCTSSFSYSDYDGVRCAQNVKRPDSCVPHEPGRVLL
jgi:hypothetical protein